MILPFDDDQLWDIISCKESIEKPYIIEVKQSYSNLKDALLTYIANIDIPVEFDFTDCSYDERLAVFKQWLDLKKIVYNQQMVNTLLHILFNCKKIENDYPSIFSESEIVNLVESNIEYWKLHVNFLESTLLYYVYGLNNLHDQIDITQYPELCVDISTNIVNVFYDVGFAGFYSSIVSDQLKWFKKQFENPVFNYDNLAKYIFNENNIIFGYALTLEK